MRLFDWTNWKKTLLPPLEPHSEAKLQVLRSYVEDYICILCADSFGRDAFRITLVDGFAGGGAVRERESRFAVCAFGGRRDGGGKNQLGWSREAVGC